MERSKTNKAKRRDQEVTTSIEVEPELFAAIKHSVVEPLQGQEELFEQLGYEPFDHFGEIVAEIMESWQVKSLLEDIIACPEDYEVIDPVKCQEILDGRKPIDGELREIFEHTSQYDGPMLIYNELKCSDESLALLTTGEQMGQGGINVVFVGFFSNDKAALQAARNHPGFYIL